MKKPPFLSPDEAIAAFKEGKMIILMDNPDRENEGDLVVPAQTITPQQVNFMVCEGRGLVCHVVDQETANRLELHPMVSKNTAPLSTAFTISVDAKDKTSTGISVMDRWHTIKILQDPGSSPDDLVVPGHLFPLVAHPGGLLCRDGHTEASLYLAQEAGLSGGAIICEILDKDGSMARLPRLTELALEWDMGIAFIDELVEWLKKQAKRNLKGALK